MQRFKRAMNRKKRMGKPSKHVRRRRKKAQRLARAR